MGFSSTPYFYTNAQSPKSESLYIDTTSKLETSGKMLYISFPKEYDTYATASADTLLKVEKISGTTFEQLSKDRGFLFYNK